MGSQKPHRRWHLRRRGQRRRLPSSDSSALPVFGDSGGLRLHEQSRLPHGPPYEQGRPSRQILHPPAQRLRLRRPRHHGHARHRKPPRSPRHHPHPPFNELLRPPPRLLPHDRALLGPSTSGGRRRYAGHVSAWHVQRLWPRLVLQTHAPQRPRPRLHLGNASTTAFPTGKSSSPPSASAAGHS